VGSGRRDSHRLGNSRYRQAITHLQPKGLAATGWQCIQGSTDPRQVVSSERATVRGQTGVREVEPKLTVGTGLVQAVVLLGPLDVVYEYVSSNSDDPWDELAAAEVELVDRLARGFPRVGRDVVCGRLVNHAGRDERADLGEVRAVQVAEGVPIAGLGPEDDGMVLVLVVGRVQTSVEVLQPGISWPGMGGSPPPAPTAPL